MANTVTIDLTTGRITKEAVNDAIEKKFIGGFGICCKLAYELIKPGIDPLSPDNPIIIGTGTLVGTPVPSANKIFALTKCPVQASRAGHHFIGYGSAGTVAFGRNLRKAGCDFLILTGKAKSPSYVYIDSDNIRIGDATDLWNEKDTYETTDYLQDKYPGCGTITIGRGGEKLVRYAMALADKKGTLGREGVGAVLGSKNIKAIVTRGSDTVEVFDRERLKKLASSVRKEGIKNPGVKALHKWGSHAGWEGYLQALNVGVWTKAKWDDLYGLEKLKEVKGGSKACNTCFLACKTSYKVKDGEFAGLETDTGHSVVAAFLAQRLEIEDYRNALKLLDMCNRAGLCFCTATNIVDFVTRLYAEGKLSEQQSDGLALPRNFDTYLKLFSMIINREGMGNTLAEGWYATSEKMGFDAVNDHNWVGIVKGVDPILDARFWGLSGTTFANIVNPRAHHGNAHCMQFGGGDVYEVETLKSDLRGMGAQEAEVTRVFTPVPYYGRFNVGRLTKHLEERGTIMQALGLCDNFSPFMFFPMSKLAECYSAVTGIETSPEELKKAGERIHNLFKVLNVREGFSRADDIVPAWFKPVDAPDGTAVMKDYYGERTLSEDDVNKLLDDYYDERGWDKVRGVPTNEKLTELGLEEFID